ncbi:MAG: PadR family transcriptional regulator [Leptolyngbya sp. SIO4C1]|nr:PadR family transcriptional regulator [Leptolyngbya sp. SIO4C1]
MFRNFRSPAFAWAAGPDDYPFFSAHRHSRRGGPDRADKGWGQKPRRRRGDIKFILLGLIAERPQHGYELIKELENRRGGFRRLSPGSVYPTLQMLEEAGHLTSEEIDGKKVYTITESGQALLQARQQTDDAHVHAGVEQSPELMELRQSLTALNAAVTQLAQNGSSAQIEQAAARLNQVKREIYALLAQAP